MSVSNRAKPGLLDHSRPAGVVGDGVDHLESKAGCGPGHLGVMPDDRDPIRSEPQRRRDGNRVGPAEDGIERYGFVDQVVPDCDQGELVQVTRWRRTRALLEGIGVLRTVRLPPDLVQREERPIPTPCAAAGTADRAIAPDRRY